MGELTEKERNSLENDKICVLWKRGNYKEFGLKNRRTSSNDGFFEFQSEDFFNKVAAFRLNKVGILQNKTSSFKLMTVPEKNKLTEKDATLVISKETEVNLAQFASEDFEFEEISLNSPPKSKFSDVKINIKVMISSTQKKLDDDQHTRAESIYEMDPT